MSRRVVYAFAIACTALGGWSAAADPECFDAACRLPDVVDVPTQPSAALMAAGQPAANHRETPVVDAVPPPLIELQANAVRQEPAHPRPQMVVDPAVRPAPVVRPAVQVAAQPVVRPAPYHSAQAAPRPAAVAPQVRPVPHVAPAVSYGPQDDPRVQEVVEQHQEQVEVARTVSRAPRRVVGYGTTPGYVVNQRPSHGGAGVVVVAPVVYGGGGIVAVARPDPIWRRCQIDRSWGSDLCGPASYYPYGAGGYRPNGTYQPYAPAPSVGGVPNARVITLQAGD